MTIRQKSEHTATKADILRISRFDKKSKENLTRMALFLCFAKLMCSHTPLNNIMPHKVSNITLPHAKNHDSTSAHGLEIQYYNHDYILFVPTKSTLQATLNDNYTPFSV